MPTHNAAFHAAQEHEERNRLLAYRPLAPVLLLPLVGGRAFPFPVLTLRWRHVLELLRLGNAFLAEVEAQPGDFEEFLWLLHPYHPDNRASLRSRPFALPLYAWLSRLLLNVVCRQLARGGAEKIIRQRLRDAFQDRERPSGGEGAESASLLAPTVNEFDHVFSFLAGRGHSWETFLDFPVALALQLQRLDGLRDPKRENNFTPPSARLIELPAEAAP